MTKWINKQGVQLPSGDVLQRAHRFYYHYIENDHVMKIYVEPLRNPDDGYFEEISFGQDMKWEAPYESEKISSIKLEAIKKNVSSALDFMGIKHSFKSEII